MSFLRPTPPSSNSVTEHIGATPLVRFNRVPQSLGINADVYGKLEYFNAGGSVKDRIVKRMVEEAEQSGQIKPGDTLIEATSGNTGIALAIMTAVKGYRCVITLSERMSKEKMLLLQALDATIVQTPAGVSIDSPESIINVAKRLHDEIPHSHILDQYTNPNNPLAHELGTAEEIWSQTSGKLDAVVIGVGTGGTLTGVARGLHKHNPDIIIVGVDPVGSVLAKPESLNTDKEEYEVEGIGSDFLPQVLDQDAADLWVKTTDKESFLFMRRLVREEGFLCGESSGAAVAGLVEAVKSHPDIGQPGKSIVVILPDSIRNYLTRFAELAG